MPSLSSILLSVPRFAAVFLCLQSFLCSSWGTDDNPLFFEKPKPMKAMEWVERLNETWKQAFFSHRYQTLKAVAQELRETFAGKYGLSKRTATEVEKRTIIGSVFSIGQYFKEQTDIIHSYFAYDPKGCWEKVETDRSYAKHMATLLAIDGIGKGTRNKTDFFQNSPSSLLSQLIEDHLIKASSDSHASSSGLSYSASVMVVLDTISRFEDGKRNLRENPTLQKITQHILDTHREKDEDRLKALMNTLSIESWKDTLTLSQSVWKERVLLTCKEGLSRLQEENNRFLKEREERNNRFLKEREERNNRFLKEMAEWQNRMLKKINMDSVVRLS